LSYLDVAVSDLLHEGFALEEMVRRLAVSRGEQRKTDCGLRPLSDSHVGLLLV
jgi:hypothetical protein